MVGNPVQLRHAASRQPEPAVTAALTRSL